MVDNKIDNDRATLLDLLTKQSFSMQDVYVIQANLESLTHIKIPNTGLLDETTVCGVKDKNNLNKGGGIIDFLNKNPLYASRVNQEIRSAIQKFSPNNELLKTPKFTKDARYETVSTYLGKDYPLDDFEIKGLQTKLGIKAPDGDLGSTTITKILDYLEKHPKDFATIGLPMLNKLMEQEGDAKRLADIAKKSPEYLTRVQKLWDSANSWPTDKTNAKTYNLQILLQTGGFLSPLPAHADGGFGDNVLKAVNKFEKFPKPAASLSDTFDAARIIPKAQPPVFKGPATETAANPQISRLQPPTRR